MIDHVAIDVGDLEGAKRLYSEALAPLGYTLLPGLEAVCHRPE
jgi:catechol 2,3-dioxygenase-like lactoylglutathione lyase family enzyme